MSNLVCVPIHEEVSVLMDIENHCAITVADLITDHLTNLYVGTLTMMPSELLVGEYCTNEHQYFPMVSIIEKVIEESIRLDKKLVMAKFLKDNPLHGVLYMESDLMPAVNSNIFRNPEGVEDVFNHK